MIMVVGSGSWIAGQMASELLETDSLVCVGRSEPKWMRELIDSNRNHKISFLHTDYVSASHILLQGWDNVELTVLFAGVGVGPGLVVNTSQADFERDLQTHLGFSFGLVKGLLPSMIRMNYGRFIFFGSVHASRGIIGSAVYSMVKSGQLALSRSIALEYGRFGVTSNVISLGNMGGGYFDRLSSGAQEEVIRNSSRKSAIANPMDVVSLIRTIQRAPTINGASLAVDAAV